VLEHIRLTPAERAEIERAAGRAGQTRTAFVRDAALEKARRG
jgi:uncharacterized protein (DUF1778 family)